MPEPTLPSAPEPTLPSAPVPPLPSSPDLSYLASVRESYDTVAVAYADRVPAPSDLDPLSRALLGAFAESVREAGGGVVADVGCGPGKVSAHLAGLGLTMTGVDLSPEMVRLARESHPELPFRVGSMTALPFADGELTGVLAYYSTHHTPPGALPVVFGEFRRVLAPGGILMVSGHVGGRRGAPPDAGLRRSPGVVRELSAARGRDRRADRAGRSRGDGPDGAGADERRQVARRHVLRAEG
ncbi:class I SAM-dependent methyltransferase [Streptomyces indicus]|uniref:Methyltransferase domain-containing protein n=1 Tax=Streptomyces indicus TaxID=417292 RepID=A0A1G8TKG6_9ACTN|nr:Methyltransferase domain-containing protein [Streptomyces indicus]